MVGILGIRLIGLDENFRLKKIYLVTTNITLAVNCRGGSRRGKVEAILNDRPYPSQVSYPYSDAERKALYLFPIYRRQNITKSNLGPLREEPLIGAILDPTYNSEEKCANCEGTYSKKKKTNSLFATHTFLEAVGIKVGDVSSKSPYQISTRSSEKKKSG